MPSTDVSTIWAGLRQPPWRFFRTALPWRALAYLASTVALTLVAVAPALATWFLAPLWSAGLARLERRRVGILNLPRIPNPSRGAPSGIRARIRTRVRDPMTWWEFGYLVAFAGFALVDFAVLVAELTSTMLFAETLRSASPDPENVIARWVESTKAPSALVLTTTALIVVALLYIGTALVAGQAMVARGLLSARSVELERRLDELTFSRRALLEGFQVERRRIERDLHDGAQQRLVALSMNLGILEMEIEDLAARGADVAAARAALEDVRDDADLAVNSLRQSVRGISPQVLLDRGLAAALHELVARSPLPGTVAVDLPVRPHRDIEAAAYFVVSEALTNSIRHAHASAIAVRAGEDGDHLWLEVEDDGIGGASITGGSGIRGLRDRADVLGGTLSLFSPGGGPTTLRLVLPVHLAG